MTVQSTEAQWAPRPVLALGVRVAQYGLPLLAGTLATWLLAPIAARVLPAWAAWLLSLAVAVTVSLLVSSLTMRLAPLAVLLRMTMIFPDHAPSRLKVARRSTGADEIRRRLVSEHADEQEAAVTMLALVTALGRHDRHTRGHSERVRLFCDLLARELGMPAADAGRLRWAALIHDVGKLEVSAAVLNKPGRLDRDEWVQVRLHPQAGARLAQPLRAWLGPWFAGIAEHHERYDGGGYPMGLAGDQISLAGRAIAVVDAFETMTAARSYQAARTAVAARAELTRCAGTHFDPAMVRAFLAIALPRLLWSVGPLAFAINVPFLRFIGDGGVRLAQAAGATASGAAGAAVNAAGVTAVVVAAGALPPAAPAATAAPKARQQVTARPTNGPAAVAARTSAGHSPTSKQPAAAISREPIRASVPPVRTTRAPAPRKPKPAPAPKKAKPAPAPRKPKPGPKPTASGASHSEPVKVKQPRNPKVDGEQGDSGTTRAGAKRGKKGR